MRALYDGQASARVRDEMMDSEGLNDVETRPITRCGDDRSDATGLRCAGDGDSGSRPDCGLTEEGDCLS